MILDHAAYERLLPIASIVTVPIYFKVSEFNRSKRICNFNPIDLNPRQPFCKVPRQGHQDICNETLLSSVSCDANPTYSRSIESHLLRR